MSPRNSERSGVQERASNAAQQSNNPTSHHPTPLPLRSAFTLIEFIGVLAVIAILAAVLVPNIIRRTDIAAKQREISDLKVMADGLVRTILTDKQILPTNNINNIPNAIAKYLDLSLNQVTNTPRRFKRAFLTDPNVNIGGFNLRTAPYVQGSSGSSSQPTNARMMIVSTLAKALPSISASSFNNIWTNTDGTVPSSLIASNWGGKAEDLCIQRIELGGLFHKLYLLNIDLTNYGYYGFESTAVPYPYVFSVYENVANGGQGGGRVTAYVFDGTAVNLSAHGADNAQGPVQLRVIIRQDESFVYQNNQWSRSLSSDQLTLDLDPNSFGGLANEFLRPPFRTGKFGATQRAVMDLFYAYLWSYWSWADASANNPTVWVGQNDTASQNPFFITVIGAQDQLTWLTGNLLLPP